MSQPSNDITKIASELLISLPVEEKIKVAEYIASLVKLNNTKNER